MSKFFVPSYFRETFQIERQAAGAYVGGVYVPGGVLETVTVTDSSVQPATQQQVELLPEGQRVKASLAIFTDTLIKTVDEQTKIKADVVIARGKRWEVQKVLEHGTPWLFYEAIATLIDGQ